MLTLALFRVPGIPELAITLIMKDGGYTVASFPPSSDKRFPVGGLINAKIEFSRRVSYACGQYCIRANSH